MRPELSSTCIKQAVLCESSCTRTNEDADYAVLCILVSHNTPLKFFQSITVHISDSNRKYLQLLVLSNNLMRAHLKSQQSRAKAILGKTEMETELECQTSRLCLRAFFLIYKFICHNYGLFQGLNEAILKITILQKKVKNHLFF